MEREKGSRAGPTTGVGGRLNAALSAHNAHTGDGWTLTDIAREVGKSLKRKVDRSTVSLWRHNKQEPTLAEFTALGKVLETDAATLAFGDVAKRPSGSGSVSVNPARPSDVADGKRKGGGGAA